MITVLPGRRNRRYRELRERRDPHAPRWRYDTDHRETGSVSPVKFGGYKGYALAAHEERVRKLVAEQPDITLAELKAVLAVSRRSPDFCII